MTHFSLPVNNLPVINEHEKSFLKSYEVAEVSWVLIFVIISKTMV